MVNVRDIVLTLQSQLHDRGIPYLKDAKQVNNNLMITCPYHKNGREQSPSCGILLNDRNYGGKLYKAGTVHCFTCGATHSLEETISYLLGFEDNGRKGKDWLLTNFSILSTADIVFDMELGLPTPVQEVPYKKFKQYHSYFKSRGVSDKVADAFDLGFDDATNSVVLPLFDKTGKCIMLIKRSLTEHIYINTSGGHKTSSLFGIQVLYKLLPKLVNNEYVFITEGPFDVLKMWQAGFPAVGIMQASISTTQLDLIKKLPFNKIVIATDNDSAGREVAWKLADALHKVKDVYIMTYPNGVKDPGEMTEDQLREVKLVPYHAKKTSFRH